MRITEDLWYVNRKVLGRLWQVLRVLSRPWKAQRRTRRISNQAEMVTGPHTVDRPLEDAVALQDLQRVSSVRSEAYQNLIDTSERPVTKRPHPFDNLIFHNRIPGRERVTRVIRVCALQASR